MKTILALSIAGLLTFAGADFARAQLPGGSPPAVAAFNHSFWIDTVQPGAQIPRWTWPRSFHSMAECAEAIGREQRFTPRRNVQYQIRYVRNGVQNGTLWSSGLIPGQ